uniref:Uncharacterized protein n=1 Tax=Acrobeloides nanus TaxID=290746 RepID=A0A914BVJ2_9BILA
MMISLILSLSGILIPYWTIMKYDAFNIKGHAGLNFGCKFDSSNVSRNLVQFCDKWYKQSYGWEIASKSLIDLAVLLEILTIIYAIVTITMLKSKKIALYILPALATLTLVVLAVGIGIYAGKHNDRQDATEANVTVYLAISFWLAASAIITNLIAALIGGFIIVTIPEY